MPRDAAPSPATTPTVHYEQDGVLIATWRNISIVVWGAGATPPVVREFGKISATLLRSHQTVSNIQIIVDNAPMPTPEARAALVKLTELGANNLACVATVLAGQGFWASTMRSFVTNVHWVKQWPFVSLTYTTIGDAAVGIPPIHTRRSGVAVTAQELEAVLTSAHRRVV